MGAASTAGATGAAQAARVALRSPAGAALVTATVLASMVGSVDAYMINVAVPAIGHDLRAGVVALQWVVTGAAAGPGPRLTVPARPHVPDQGVPRARRPPPASDRRTTGPRPPTHRHAPRPGPSPEEGITPAWT